MPLVGRWLRERGAEGIGADVFLVLGDHVGGHLSIYGHFSVECPRNETIVDELQPVRKALLAPPGLVGRAANCGKTAISVVAYQVSYILHCMQLVAEHEQERGRQYEQVVFARPDLLLLDTLSPSTFAAGPTRGCWHSDFIFGGPREAVWRHFEAVAASVPPCHVAGTGGFRPELESFVWGEPRHIKYAVMRGVDRNGDAIGFMDSDWLAGCITPAERAMLTCPGMQIREVETRTDAHGLSYRALDVCRPRPIFAGEGREAAAARAEACEEACWADDRCSAWSAQGPEGCRTAETPVQPPCECSEPAGVPLAGYRFQEHIVGFKLVGAPEWQYHSKSTADAFRKCAADCYLKPRCTAWSFTETLGCMGFYAIPLRRERRAEAASGFIPRRFPQGP